MKAVETFDPTNKLLDEYLATEKSTAEIAQNLTDD